MSADERGAQHVHSSLMRESLVDRHVIARSEAQVTAILPDVNVIQIGGRSIMDRGRSALMPLLDEIVANQSKHRMIIGVGAGVRSRDIFFLWASTWVYPPARSPLSALKMPHKMLIWFLACWRNTAFVYLEAPFVVQLLPAMLAGARGAVFNGIPPYSLWEHPAAVGKLPPHGSDAG